MIKRLEFSAKTIEEAMELALKNTGMSRDDVSMEVLSYPSRGFLGIGSVPARIAVSFDDGQPEPAAEAAQRPAPTQRADRTERTQRADRADRAERAERAERADREDRADGQVPGHLHEKYEKISPKPAAGSSERAERGDRGDRAPRGDRQSRPPRGPRGDRPRRDRDERPAEAVRPAETARETEREDLPPLEPALLEAGAEKARAFLADVLPKMGVSAESEITLGPRDIHIDLSGSDMGVVIGRRGETLDALQYLCALVVNKGEKEYIKVTLDTENYRLKREETLTRLARKLAGKVQRYHRSITLEPMNPYERRIIHSSLKGEENITTFSTGTEPNRRVVIALAGRGRGDGRRPRRDRGEAPRYAEPEQTFGGADEAPDTADAFIPRNDGDDSI